MFTYMRLVLIKVGRYTSPIYILLGMEKIYLGAAWKHLLLPEVMIQFDQHTPPKINGCNIISWRFGSDHFPFFSWLNGCRFLSPLIFQGVLKVSNLLKKMGYIGEVISYLLTFY